MDEYSTYEFRVIANANDEGYPKPGVAGPESDAIQPICISKFVCNISELDRRCILSKGLMMGAINIRLLNIIVFY